LAVIVVVAAAVAAAAGIVIFMISLVGAATGRQSLGSRFAIELSIIFLQFAVS